MLQEVRKILAEYDIRLGAWNSWEDELKQRLSTGVNPKVIATLNKITENAEQLQKMIKPKEASL
ncbi:hypothetical protein D3C76_1736360 [compost metagenome]